MIDSQILPIFNKILPQASPQFCEDFYKILKDEHNRNNQPWLKNLILLVDGINADNSTKNLITK